MFEQIRSILLSQKDFLRHQANKEPSIDPATLATGRVRQLPNKSGTDGTDGTDPIVGREKWGTFRLSPHLPPHLSRISFASGECFAQRRLPARAELLGD